MVSSTFYDLRQIRADLARHAEERLKLYVGVAIGAGDGRASGEVLVNKRTNDA